MYILRRNSTSFLEFSDNFIFSMNKFPKFLRKKLKNFKNNLFFWKKSWRTSIFESTDVEVQHNIIYDSDSEAGGIFQLDFQLSLSFFRVLCTIWFDFNRLVLFF